MGTEFLFDQQVALLEIIATHRKIWLDPIFLALNLLDSFWGYLLLLLACWLRMGKMRGFHLFCLYFSIYTLVFFLKFSFNVARPPEQLWMIHPSYSSFPSGGAANMTVILGFLITQCNKTWQRLLLGSLIFLNAFSRLYLGVHFPLDVLAGVLLGLTILIIYFESIDPILTIFEKTAPFTHFLIGSFILMLLYFYFPKTVQLEMFYFLTLGIFSAMAIRSYLPLPFAEKKTNGVITLFAIGALSLIYSMIPPVSFPLILPYLFIVGLIVPLIGPWASHLLLYPKKG